MSVSSVCVCPSVCLSVTLRKPRFLVDWRLLVEEHVANIGITLDFFLDICFFDDFSHFVIFRVLGYFQTSLLCIMGE